MWQKSSQDPEAAIDANDRSGEWVLAFGLEPPVRQFKIAP